MTAPPSRRSSTTFVWFNARAPFATASCTFANTSRCGSTPHSSMVTAPTMSGVSPGSILSASSGVRRVCGWDFFNGWKRSYTSIAVSIRSMLFLSCGRTGMRKRTR